MKPIKFLASIICIGLVSMSCSKNSSPSMVSPSSAKQTFSTVNTDVAAAVSGLNTAPGNVALNSFSNLNNTTSPFGRIRSFSQPGDVKTALGVGLISIRQMLLNSTGAERAQGSQPFNFASKKGTYSWNSAGQKWDYISGGDIIKIDYPKDKNSSTNDAELQISEYSETLIGNDYYPTSIQAAIYTPIGTKQLGLTLTAGYGNTTQPNKASIDLFINPYTISFSYDDSNANSTTEAFSFSKGSTVYIGTSATAAYASTSDKTSGHPSTVTGYVQLENVRFDMSIDGSKASTAQSNNDFMVITVNVDGGVAGHVVWVSDQNGNQQPYVQYNDKTQQPLSAVFTDLQTQLNSLG